MEFRNVLGRRRMHRAFLPDPIPVEQIERIVGVIRRAPSAGFSQGCSIVVVTTSRSGATRACARRGRLCGSGSNFIAEAPVQLVISVSETAYHARYNEADKLAVTGGVELEWPVPYWFVDAGALMMLVLMAAIDEGLASAFVGHPDQKSILDGLLGLPEDVVPIGLALIGKPGDDPWAGSRLRSAAGRSARSSTGSDVPRRIARRTSSTNAASRSAIAASSSSSTFSAFCSPERERLNEPTKTVSSQTMSFACMKSCTVPLP